MIPLPSFRQWAKHQSPHARDTGVAFAVYTAWRRAQGAQIPALLGDAMTPAQFSREFHSALYLRAQVGQHYNIYRGRA